MRQSEFHRAADSSIPSFFGLLGPSGQFAWLQFWTGHLPLNEIGFLFGPIVRFASALIGQFTAGVMDELGHGTIHIKFRSETTPEKSDPMNPRRSQAAKHSTGIIGGNPGRRPFMPDWVCLDGRAFAGGGDKIPQGVLRKEGANFHYPWQCTIERQRPCLEAIHWPADQRRRDCPVASGVRMRLAALWGAQGVYEAAAAVRVSSRQAIGKTR